MRRPRRTPTDRHSCAGPPRPSGRPDIRHRRPRRSCPARTRTDPLARALARAVLSPRPCPPSLRRRRANRSSRAGRSSRLSRRSSAPGLSHEGLNARRPRRVRARADSAAPSGWWYTRGVRHGSPSLYGWDAECSVSRGAEAHADSGRPRAVRSSRCVVVSCHCSQQLVGGWCSGGDHTASPPDRWASARPGLRRPASAP
jgi:hypothetical protein